MKKLLTLVLALGFLAVFTGVGIAQQRAEKEKGQQVVPLELLKADTKEASKASITPTSPTEERPAKNNRPTFEWKTESAIEGITYAIIVREIQEGVGLESGKIVFEQSGIRENVFQYPAKFPPLDTSKVYVWKVTGIKNDKVIAVSQIQAILQPGIQLCWLIPFNPTQKICLGQTPSLCVLAIMTGSGPYNWTLTSSYSSSQSGSQPGGFFTSICVTPTPPPPAGVCTYTLKVTRGTCTKIATFTVSVYPNLTAEILDNYPPGNLITALCYGEDATLNMNGVPPSCQGQVTWQYSTNGGSTWITAPGGGVGNPYNTNQINWFTCTGNFVNVLFKGTVNPNCLNLPTPWPISCSNEITVPLQVWCPTYPGTISVSSGIQICSNNNYPVNVTATVTGYMGTILGWTINNGPLQCPNQPTCTFSITSAGNYTICVKVQNGTCPQQSACITVQVEDPINAQITSNVNEVCWGDDAILTLNHNGPPGSQIQWQYQINCTGGPWTTTGVGGTVQNTNELFGPSYPGVVPPSIMPCDPNKICWQAIVSSPTGICPPTTTNTLTINVIVPPTAPTISPPGPLIKCPDMSVSLSASAPSCGTPPLIYQWYLNGLPVPGGQTIQATQPGNYYVEVSNKNNCASAQSANTVTVRDCITTIVVEGPCTCSPGAAVTLTAIPTSTVVPPGPPGNCGPPYSYLWSTGATTQSITIPCPTQTTTLWVEVTNAMGCKTKVFHTIKKCQ